MPSRKPARGVREPPGPAFAAAPSARATTVVSAKGQVVLPKALRDALGWDAGVRLIVEATADGLTLRRDKPALTPTRIEDVFGMLRHKAILPVPSDEDVNRAIGKKLAEDDERIRRDRG